MGLRRSGAVGQLAGADGASANQHEGEGADQLGEKRPQVFMHDGGPLGVWGQPRKVTGNWSACKPRRFLFFAARAVEILLNRSRTRNSPFMLQFEGDTD